MTRLPNPLDVIRGGGSTSDVAFSILANSGPRPRRRVRDVVSCQQRWRRRRDGTVVVVRQVHRMEWMVEVSYVAAVDALGLDATCWPVPFDRLTTDFELLVDLRGTK